MRTGNAAGEIIAIGYPELLSGPSDGLEAVERLFVPDRTAGAVVAGTQAPVGPEIDPCEKPPTARQLRAFVPNDEELRALSSSARLFGAAGVNLEVLTVDVYGAPSYGPLAKPEGMVIHTPENVDHTLAQAIAIAKWQASRGNTSGGSYMGILGWNGTRPMSDPLGWTMVRSVPWNVAAGGLSTRRDSVWAPGRYPWIAELLSDAAYGDPNRYLHQLAVSGKAAWWSSKLKTAAGRAEVRGALIALARWTRILETSYKYDAVLTLHRHWQTNRTDPDGLDFADHVLAEYGKLEPSSSFTDVPPEHWAYPSIEWMASEGLTAGTGEGKYEPDRAVTRAEMAVFLHRALGR